MDSHIINSFPSIYFIFVAFFILCMLFEQILPLRKRKSHIIKRFTINILMTMVALGTASIFVKPVSEVLIRWTETNSFGLLHVFHIPTFFKSIIGFFLMDLTFYWWHRANHRLPYLWRFHNMHHIDPDLDVTTSFRFHFGEIFLSSGFRILQIGIIGLQPITYFVYEFTFICSTMLHHSNIRLPIKFERALNLIIVTPRMHGIHHSIVCEETDSNYSVILRLWDQIHKTLRLNIPQKDITIGVPGYSEPEDNTIIKLLSMPFLHQKDYWHRPDGSVIVGTAGTEPKGLH